MDDVVLGCIAVSWRRFFSFIRSHASAVKRHEASGGFWFLQWIDFFIVRLYSLQSLPVAPATTNPNIHIYIWRTTTTSCCSAHVKAGRRIASYPLRLPGWLPNVSTLDWYCLRAAPLPWASMRVHSSPRCLPTRMHWCASTCSAFSTREISRAVGFQKAQRLRC